MGGLKLLSKILEMVYCGQDLIQELMAVLFLLCNGASLDCWILLTLYCFPSMKWGLKSLKCSIARFSSFQ